MTPPVHLPAEYATQKPAPIIGQPAPILIRGRLDGSGATIKFPTVPATQRWWIDYLTLTAALGLPTASVYLDDPTDPANLLDYTPDASKAVAAYSPARQLPAGTTLIVVFAGGTPNASCSARLEYRTENL